MSVEVLLASRNGVESDIMKENAMISNKNNINDLEKLFKAAKSEGNKAAERSFTYANAVEKVQADLYKKALDNLDNP